MLSTEVKVNNKKYDITLLPPSTTGAFDNGFILYIMGKDIEMELEMKPHDDRMIFRSNYYMKGSKIRVTSGVAHRTWNTAHLMIYDNHSFDNFDKITQYDNIFKAIFTNKQQKTIIDLLIHARDFGFKAYPKVIGAFRKSIADYNKKEMEKELALLMDVMVAFETNDFSKLTIDHQNVCRHFEGKVRLKLDDMKEKGK